MQLPTGTVTFLFTDVEGSTRLWEQHSEQMRAALARHDVLAKEAVGRHGGALINERGEGDSLFAVFARASDALTAVCALQKALTSEPWPSDAPLRVRMALHTGEVSDMRDGNYYGATVNRCARLRSIGHGGQTLLSMATCTLVQDQLPPGCSLKDMGRHRLKDLQAPEQVFQLIHPALPAEFPYLKSLDNLPTNLPRQVSSFIGREQEMAEVKRLLASTALLTLTGSGGCGKTRLALQVAADLVESCKDGVWLAELASLSDPALVSQAVASVLALREGPGKTLTETLSDYLQGKELLLVLDNCEHLVDACAALAATLLRACPRLRILATSRQPLNISGETAWRVPSMLPPDPARLPTEEKDLAGVLLDYDAVHLFVERAREHQPSFALSRWNSQAVAAVCHRLEGIPLAIELAAARVRAMGLEQIVERLKDRFRLLTGGSRTAPTRQQTLRAAMDWSYDLLSEEERLLLGRVSVFAGGWTLEAAEAVCSGDRIEAPDVLDGLTSLVDQSLVVFEEAAEDSGRYRLLETMRHYGEERLTETGTLWRWRTRHRAFFLALVEQAGPQLMGPEQARWFARLEAEHDNLRAVLIWCLESPFGAENAGVNRHLPPAEAALLLCGALRRFWDTRGYFNEGCKWSKSVLELPGAQTRMAARASALNTFGMLTYRQGNYALARSYHEEARSIREELGDLRGMADSLNNLGLTAQDEARYDLALRYHHESLKIKTNIDDKPGIAVAYNNLGNVAQDMGNHRLARSYHSNSLAIKRKIGDEAGIAVSLNNLGNVAFTEKKYSSARSSYTESLKIREKLDHRQGVATCHHNLGNVALCLGENPVARSHYHQSMTIHRVLGDRMGIALSLVGFADLAQACADSERAVRLMGAAETLREDIGTRLAPDEEAEYAGHAANLREALGEQAFAAAWAKGRAMTMERAIEYALSEGPSADAQ